MTVEYEPAPKPAPLWLLPLTIAVLAVALLWAVQQFREQDVSAFGGRAQPTTPQPEQLADGSPLPDVPEELTSRFGEDVVVARRLDEVPPAVDRDCRESFAANDDPPRAGLHELITGSDVSASHLGPEVLTSLSIAVDDAPPGYPREVAISCIAEPDGDEWRMPFRPLLDFALDGRPGATLAGRDRPPPNRGTTDAIRTRLVSIPVGTRWAVQPRGGWWLAYDVSETSWALLTLNEAVSDQDPLRVVFVDGTGDVVAERGVGPTRSAAQADHSDDYELVAGSVREILDKLDRGPLRVCEPGNRTMCVWLSLDELGDVLAHAGFGPHPLDTPPMGYVGLCPKAGQLQGSVTTARFDTDGSWAGGPTDRGLDQYKVSYEAGKVVVDLSEHVTGDPAEGDGEAGRAKCEFSGKARGKAQ